MTEDPKYRIYLEEIAALFARGLSPEAVAREYDISTQFLEKCISDPQFEDIFELHHPNEYETWKSAQSGQVSKKRLKAQINEDAPEFYNIVAALVRDEHSSLTDKERCDYALKLASMSDAARKDQEVETVVLSEHQMEILKESFVESVH